MQPEAPQVTPVEQQTTVEALETLVQALKRIEMEGKKLADTIERLHRAENRRLEEYWTDG